MEIGPRTSWAKCFTFLYETFIKRHKAAFERQMYQQRGAPSAFSNKRPIRRIVSYDTKETDRGPVSEADYTKQMKAGMKN